MFHKKKKVVIFSTFNIYNIEKQKKIYNIVYVEKPLNPTMLDILFFLFLMVFYFEEHFQK